MEEPTTPTPPPQGPPPSPHPPPPSEQRRLLRSRTDRTLLGVCGGAARYLGVDATLVRIVTVALVIFGGAGALLYLAAVLLMPEEAPAGAGAVAGGPEAPTAVMGEAAPRNRALVIVGVVVLVLVAGPLLLPPVFIFAGLAIPLAFLALIGLFVWWTVSGERPEGGAGAVVRAAALGVGVLLVCGILFIASGWTAAFGGETIVAVLVIAAGAALIASAFVRPMRWLVLPALSVAIAAGFVQAAGLEIDGGVGEREYRPTTVAQIDDRYELGMGELVVDLRDVDLPAGDLDLALELGMGEAVLLVDDDVCVASRAEVGMGEIQVFDHDSGGVDVVWEDPSVARAGNARVVLDADIGLGALTVRHEHESAPWDREWRQRRGWHPDRDGDAGLNTGCVGGGRAS